jgi:hypothetical protein
MVKGAVYLSDDHSRRSPGTLKRGQGRRRRRFLPDVRLLFIYGLDTSYSNSVHGWVRYQLLELIDGTHFFYSSSIIFIHTG